MFPMRILKSLERVVKGLICESWIWWKSNENSDKNPIFWEFRKHSNQNTGRIFTNLGWILLQILWKDSDENSEVLWIKICFWWESWKHSYENFDTYLIKFLEFLMIIRCWILREFLWGTLETDFDGPKPERNSKTILMGILR